MGTRRYFSPGILLSAAAAVWLLGFPTADAAATPAIWESDFGGVITVLTGEDDEQTSQTLSFLFPFAGSSYSEVFIGTNGGLQLGTLGLDGEIDYDLWEDFGEFLADGNPVDPLILPFNTDLDLGSMGTIHFNDFSDRAVITWNNVGSFENELAPFLFQAQLIDNGTIIFGYNGLPSDLITDLDEGIVVGISPSDNPADPGTSDFLGNSPFTSGTTIYEIWCYDDALGCDNIDGTQLNDAFDLDMQNVIFTPVGSSGYAVTIPEPTTGLLVALGLAGLAALRRRPFHR